MAMWRLTIFFWKLSQFSQMKQVVPSVFFYVSLFNVLSDWSWRSQKVEQWEAAVVVFQMPWFRCLDSGTSCVYMEICLTVLRCGINDFAEQHIFTVCVLLSQKSICNCPSNKSLEVSLLNNQVFMEDNEVLCFCSARMIFVDIARQLFPRKLICNHALEMETHPTFLLPFFCSMFVCGSVISTHTHHVSI